MIESQQSRADVLAVLDNCGLEFELVPCDESLADTAAFCAHYGYQLQDSANAILIKGKSGERRLALCVLLATTKLEVSSDLRQRIGSSRVSFASAQETVAATGMELGGVTPLALATPLPIWVDAAVMAREKIILGGGDRRSKLIVSPQIFHKLPDTEVLQGLARPRD